MFVHQDFDFDAFAERVNSRTGIKIIKATWPAVILLLFHCQKQRNQSMTSRDKWIYFEQPHIYTNTSFHPHNKTNPW